MKTFLLCLIFSFSAFAQNKFIGQNSAGTANEWKTLSGTTPVTLTNGTGTCAISLSPVDTVAFVSTGTRVAKYYAGCTQAWRFGYYIRKNGLPVAGDVVCYWTKTDSVTFFRAAGTTSGEVLDIWREK